MPRCFWVERDWEPVAGNAHPSRAGRGASLTSFSSVWSHGWGSDGEDGGVIMRMMVRDCKQLAECGKTPKP